MQEGARLSNVSVVQINDMPRSVSISGVKIFKHLLVIVGSRGFVGVHNTKINTTFVPSQSSHFTESKILSVGLHSFCEQQLLIASGDRLGGLAVWVFDLLACSLDLKLFADIRQPVVCTQFIPAMPQSAPVVDARDFQETPNPNLLPMLIVGTESRCCLFIIDSEHCAQAGSSNGSPRQGVMGRPRTDSREFQWSLCQRCVIDSNSSDSSKESAYYSIRHFEWNEAIETSKVSPELNAVETTAIKQWTGHTLSLYVDKVLTNNVTSVNTLQLLRIIIRF
jgi:hypothetical protein